MENKKWHVYLANVNPRTFVSLSRAMGTEPGKVRPVEVAQIDLLNGLHPSTVVCPLTTKVQPRARFLRVHHTIGETGLKEQSDIIVDQIRAIYNRRFLGHTGKFLVKAK